MSIRGGAGNCSLCKHEKRFELEFEYIRGATLATIADMVGVTPPAIRNHFENGHCTVDVTNLRNYLIKNTISPVKQLEKRRETFLEKVLAQPEEVNQKMISATLLMCANEAHELLQEMKQREDYRGSVAAVEALRRTTMDLTALHSLKSDGKQDEVIDSADVVSLRESVMEEIRKKMGDTPSLPTEHRPLR